jgi:hypothetical protein
MKTGILILMTVLFMLIKNPLLGCTVFSASDGITVLGGNNEDYNDSNTYMWFIPAENRTNTHGRVYFGYGDSFPQGGMNDQGLFFDGLATPPYEVTGTSDKPIFQGSLIRKVMEDCSTVEEVLNIYDQYNLEHMKNYQLLFADKFSDSAIIEGDLTIRKEKYYQVVTNFYQSNPGIGGYPCWRYDTACEILDNNSEVTFELFRSVLDAVHADYTQYSNIYDLKKGIIYLFYNHNFHEFVKIDLKEELKKGWQQYRISSLFSRIKIISPDNGEVINPSPVTFRWEGDTDTSYLLYYSTDPDFTGCDPIKVDGGSMYAVNVNGVVVGSFFFGMFFFGITLKRRKKGLLTYILISLLLVMFWVSCQHNGGDEIIEPLPTYKEFQITVDNLQPGSTYYWKLTANATDYFTSESIIRMFTTGE